MSYSSLVMRVAQEVTKLVYEVSEDDVTRAKNQFKAMQLFGIDSTSGTIIGLHR